MRYDRLALLLVDELLYCSSMVFWKDMVLR